MILISLFACSSTVTRWISPTITRIRRDQETDRRRRRSRNLGYQKQVRKASKGREGGQPETEGWNRHHEKEGWSGWARILIKATYSTLDTTVFFVKLLLLSLSLWHYHHHRHHHHHWRSVFFSVETAEVICLSSFLAHIAHSKSWFLL